MEPLSSFAISIAAGIAIDLWNKSQIGVDKEIKAAFNQSIKDWSVNTDIRNRNRNSLGIKLKKILGNSELMINEIVGDSDIKTFYEIFEKRICEHASTYNFIHEIKSQERFLKEREDLLSIKANTDYIKTKVDEILKRLQDADPSQIIESDDFNLIMNEYYLIKEDKFENEVWPYQIGKEEFVSIFDFNTGSISNRSDSHIDKNCVEHINNSFKNGRCFYVGYYGMGKTTVSKFVFSTLKSTSDYDTFFISLTHKGLPNSDNLLETLFNELKENIISSRRFLLKFENPIKNKISELVSNGKLIIIFDGLDESIHTVGSLTEFAKCINDNIPTLFLTSRLEFSNFFTIFEPVFRNNGYTVELQEWNTKQWDIYLNALKIKYDIDEERIKLFNKELPNSLSDLAKRPLFFRMITDLFLINKAKIEIPDQLRGNIAAVYHEFINWKIRDDISSRGSVLHNETYNVEYFANQVFDLFKEIAIKEYSLIVENVQSSGIKVEEIKEIVENNPFYELDDKIILKLFMSSTLFSTISNENNLFKFSHKSFIEYLVAYELASSIFDKEEIDDIWDYYQTFEISDQFQSEVLRRIYYNGGGTPRDNEVLKSVFINELSKVNDFTSYSENVEEVLYYLGKFQIESEEILEKLHKITNPETNAIPEYVRTSYITLARLGKHEYLDDFVLQLIESYYDDQVLFNTNKEIDIKYYGESSIRSKLIRYVKQYIVDARLDKLNILRVFSYFTSTNIKVTNEKNISDTLNLIVKKAIEEKHEKIVRICSGIKKIIKSDSYAKE